MANFLVVINAWYSKKLVTGGKFHMLQVLKNWILRDNIALLIPKMGYQATKNMLKNVNLFYFSSKEDKEQISLFKLEIMYLNGIIRSLFVRPKDKPDIVITASHFSYDLLPTKDLFVLLGMKLGNVFNIASKNQVKIFTYY
jgi:hypothetical protein